MPLTGTNKFCQQCVNTCKQWSQVKVVSCRDFLSNQKKKPEQDAKLEKGGTLEYGQMVERTPVECHSFK